MARMLAPRFMAPPMSPQHEAAAPGHVRIIGGRWRGTRLPVPDRPGLRPTHRPRARNPVQLAAAGARPVRACLDLFAGSGALGLEALSRGAREAMLVERDPAVAEPLRASDRAPARRRRRRRSSAPTRWRCCGRRSTGVRRRLRRSAVRRRPVGTRSLAVAAGRGWPTMRWLYVESPPDAEPIAAGDRVAACTARAAPGEVRYALYRRRVAPLLHWRRIPWPMAQRPNERGAAPASRSIRARSTRSPTATSTSSTAPRRCSTG